MSTVSFSSFDVIEEASEATNGFGGSTPPGVIDSSILEPGGGGGANGGPINGGGGTREGDGGGSGGIWGGSKGAGGTLEAVVICEVTLASVADIAAWLAPRVAAVSCTATAACFNSAALTRACSAWSAASDC